MAEQGGTAALPLSVGMDGDHVQIPRPIGHSLLGIISDPHRPTIVVGISVGFVLLVVLYWVLHFWFLHQDFAGEIEAIEPKTARLLGIMQSVDQLGVASNEASARLRELAYGADRDSAKAFMTSAVIRLSSQISPACTR